MGSRILFKIDVEGSESEVLKGLSIPIKFLSFEYTVPEQSHKVTECINQILKISHKALFNYSIGENMKLECLTWLSGKEMKDLIHSDKFLQSDFGDIYVKMKPE